MSWIAATRKHMIVKAISLPLEPGLVPQTVDARKRICAAVHCVYAPLSPKTWPKKAIKAITEKTGPMLRRLQGSDRQKTVCGLGKRKLMTRKFSLILAVIV